MKRFVLDSNVFDQLLLRPDVVDELRQLISTGQVEVLSTPVQWYELTATPDELKRADLQSRYSSLTTKVPTGGFVVGVSRLDEARLPPRGAPRQLRRGAENPGEGTRDGMPGHTNDALIVHTALVEQATLVTHEQGRRGRGRMKKTAPQVGVETWPAQRFLDWVLPRPDDPDPGSAAPGGTKGRPLSRAGRRFCRTSGVSCRAEVGMPRKVTPAQYNRLVADHNRKVKQAVDKHNREVTAHNRKVKSSIDDYNRDVRAHNARVRSNRQRLNAEIARLNRQRSTTRYVTAQTSTFALHTAYSHVDTQSELWNERGQELADLAEAETANSAHVTNVLLGETAPGGEQVEETSLTDELSALSLDLHNRWEGARFALNLRNPDAARHFCTSAREVIVELIDMKAPDATVLQARPNCQRGPDGKKVARREKIGYLLDLNGADYEALGDFMETNVDDVMNLFSQFNKGTHGAAGSFDVPTLRTIKHRVEDSIRFLSTLVRGSSR